MVVYMITNKINGKKYVGQTKRSLAVRWREHLYEASSTRRNYPLYAAIRKYGKNNFNIKSITKATEQKELNSRESFVIKILNTISPNGYNLCTSGEGSVMSQETRQKMSKSATGRKLSFSAKEKISKFNKGKIVSQETKNRTSMANKGQNLGGTISETAKRKISVAVSGEKNPFFGKTHSVEVINIIKKANIGKKLSEETKKKIGLKSGQNRISIICLETKIIYSSCSEAAKDIKSSGPMFTHYFSGKIKNIKGLTFKKIDYVQK